MPTERQREGQRSARGATRAQAKPSARVILHEAEPLSLRPLLEQNGFDLVMCATGASLIEEAVRSRPHAVVYTLGADEDEDMGVLLLLRRAVHDLPLVLLAAEGSLAAERRLRDLRPLYYSVMPVDATELVSAVRSAVARGGRNG